MHTQSNSHPRAALKKARRIIVKVGTALLTGNTTHVDKRFVLKLCHAVDELWKQGKEVAIVTSGAIGAGCGALGYDTRPQTLPERQACAAAGQVELMKLYSQAFRRMKPPRAIGQLLLTRDGLTARNRYLNVRNTLTALFARGAVPVINENDSVSVEEIKFGDNDTLSALVSGVAEADALLVLTDVKGLMDADPRSNPDAKVIPLVQALTPELEAVARPTGSFLGTGGMVSKLQAAKIAMASGYALVLAAGHDPSVIHEILDGAEIGTFFQPRVDRLSARKHWMAFTRHPKGAIIVDSGARDALVQRHKSLLPSGIVGVKGAYESGELVSLMCKEHEFARGLTNFSAKEIEQIRGKKTSQVEKELGQVLFEEVVHRDNLVIL
ncbi:MAG TPA: glutamate 5-kinase [Planctomycetota bacterium]|nr:glutamate 5-kinase [Planctomycetota bacterium]